MLPLRQFCQVGSHVNEAMRGAGDRTLGGGGSQGDLKYLMLPPHFFRDLGYPSLVAKHEQAQS